MFDIKVFQDVVNQGFPVNRAGVVKRMMKHSYTLDLMRLLKQSMGAYQ